MIARREQAGTEAEAEDRPEPSVSGAAFWAVMDRWKVADDLALGLIAGPPRTKKGSRPRFRLVGAQLETYALLRAIDRHLEDLRQDPAAWFAAPNREKPFSRRSPLAFLAKEGAPALPEVLHHLERTAFRASLERSSEKAANAVPVPKRP